MAAFEGMVGVGEEAADDGGDSLRLVGKGGEDDAGLEGDGVKSLESQGDKIMEGAEAAGDRDYARDAADQHDEERIDDAQAGVDGEGLDDEPAHQQEH